MMKSILKYVICCGSAPVEHEETAAAGKEDTAFFAVATPLRETYTRQQSGRYGAVKPVFPDQKKKKSRFHWKPALCAISENKVVTGGSVPVSLAGVGFEKITIKTKKMERSNTSNKDRTAAAMNKVYARSYSDNSGRASSLSPPVFIF